MTWIHSCVAVDSALNHLTVVVNGKKLEDKAFPIPAGEQPPSDLTEKLLIFKNYIGFWPDLRNVKYFAEIKFEFKILPKTSQELRMLSSVTINCQITKIVINSGSQLSEL